MSSSTVVLYDGPGDPGSRLLFMIERLEATDIDESGLLRHRRREAKKDFKAWEKAGRPLPSEWSSAAGGLLARLRGERRDGAELQRRLDVVLDEEKHRTLRERRIEEERRLPKPQRRERESAADNVQPRVSPAGNGSGPVRPKREIVGRGRFVDAQCVTGCGCLTPHRWVGRELSCDYCYQARREGRGSVVHAEDLYAGDSEDFDNDSRFEADSPLEGYYPGNDDWKYD